MCGIFGHAGPIARELAQRCTDALAHRGPDGSGLWHTPEITLGHRRLAILDLSEHARQPMSYGNARYHLTYNGEIYNFLELRRELEAAGHRFHSDSDTEVVLAAYSEWGEACQHRFNGMWAFAIWDAQERSLFLSRDRLGKKPLFYAFLPQGGFAFASEMKALFPLLGEVRPNVPLVTDPAQIFTYESTADCVIEGIRRFPAGHCGRLRDGKLVLTRWWTTLDHLPDVPARYEEQVEMFRELFLDACRLRMRSDIPLGTALSGGLDSSATISAMAHVAGHGATARMGESWQHAFVASFPGTPLDEVRYARMVTDHLGINATVVEIDPLKAIADIDRLFYLFEDLYITSPIPFILTYGAVKARGISATLDGHGADELFGGYPNDYLIALQDAGWNLAQVRQILRAYYENLPVDSPQFESLPPKAVFWAKWHTRQAAKHFLRRGFQQTKSRDASHPRWRELDRLSRALYVSTHESVLPTLLRNYDRYSMANGVEIRMPFLDHRIVSLAFALPWSSKVRCGYSKSVVRDAMAPYLPRAIAYRKTKIGFNSPVVDWIKGPLKSFMLDTINSQAFKTCGLINPRQVAQAVRHVMDDPDAQFAEGERAWKMLMPFLWERAVIHRRGGNP